MKKIYWASPISKYVRNGMNEDYTSTIDAVYELLSKYGEVYYPLKKEAYGEDKKAGSGDVCTKIDFDKVNDADFTGSIGWNRLGKFRKEKCNNIYR